MPKRRWDWPDDNPRPRRRPRPPILVNDDDPDPDDFPAAPSEDDEESNGPDGVVELTNQLADLAVGRLPSPLGRRPSPGMG